MYEKQSHKITLFLTENQYERPNGYSLGNEQTPICTMALL